ncbi:hypothetical protein A3D77_03775 [Candidatus Gottesmanbacteria bacterium RIFCSPHIGHO2_02_FULL_39_11]|uniref:Uncharacterized protein n=1 Tax=Candidatus Gottesmanbacteria bacterium RIFCSPHIGHO2_02_FULL_39_11 TaxID=1798382 RepID=A0A1F5ZX26_9BACT|nr:MAG: hypothetical protein A3D77_03775 [Candidatus Gottesmanbacteria bacterium RIFCSPHIGHO2_02_FULL_39_11]
MSRNESLLLAIIFFITVITWIILGIYRANTESTVTSTQQEEIRPLNAEFDTKIIQSLQQRE